MRKKNSLLGVMESVIVKGLAAIDTECPPSTSLPTFLKVSGPEINQMSRVRKRVRARGKVK